ncbi:PDZ domain-containing protein [Cytobacillus purgationiresistens]|uniref:PDZ domain-containing protein n=1 Tax=Cytobacillus purgationiresistens TaxID=863449 RepID=A0ABU0ADE8_9BACI|nr:PDZ domain-containing protein [Cytobacillus purgationiresistens]MDQ0269070.1 hypothetical protein [Cytobacillus purgationiresistens]
MAEVWLVEFLKGTGKVLLNPVFYLVFLAAAFYGVQRVKRERQHFSVRAENAYFELRQLVPLGLLIGIGLSVITITAGLVVPMEMVVFTAAITMLLMLTPKVRWLAPAYTLSLGLLVAYFAIEQQWPLPAFLTSSGVTQSIYPAAAVLIALMVIAEGMLISRNGKKGTSPRLMKSRRGQQIGMHEVKRLWLLPVFLLIPGEALTLTSDWWPVFSIGGNAYSLILVPFAVGYQQQIQGSLPKKAIEAYGKRVIVFGILLLLLSSAVYLYPIAALGIAGLAIIGREFLNYRQRVTEKNAAFFFSKRNQGLMVIGIVPDSPADKMELQVGEVVTKVNGFKVNDEKGFYDSLQKNAAHCKLEVLDVSNEIRFVQRALYVTDHHELGILFIKDEMKRGEKAG